LRFSILSFNRQRAPGRRYSEIDNEIAADNFEKRGHKVFGGVALFRDHPLPVRADGRFVAGFLEADQVTKSVFKRSRFLLPVSRYKRLKFSEGRQFGGIMLESQSSKVVRSASVKRLLAVLKHNAKIKI